MKMFFKTCFIFLSYTWVQNEGINIDIDTINEVISCLTVNGDIEEAFDVLERLNLKSFGKDVVGDFNSYMYLISQGGKGSNLRIEW